MFKAQLATIEVLASVLLISTVLGIGIKIIEYATIDAERARSFSIMNIAAYDFIYDAYSNLSLGECINTYNSTCLELYLSEFASTYNLKGIMISSNTDYIVGNISGSTLVRCFPYFEKEFCLYMSRGN
ncbi:MAG: hypothetical protein ACP5RT_01520 [Candidatus Micrarchaeia archaeon]